MELVEVYRVIYDGPDDHLQGIIGCLDSENGMQYLFTEKGLNVNHLEKPPFEPVDDDYEPYEPYLKADYYTNNDKRLTMPIIQSGDHIMLNGPTKASIRATPGFGFDFYLFGAIYKNINIEYPESFSAPLRQLIVSDKGNRYLTILYAVFQRAAESCVKVKLSNFNSNSDTHLFGVISASTSAIKHPAYSSLLYFMDDADPGEKIQVRSGHDLVIPLFRNFVAVPLESELILELDLFGDDGEKIVVDTVTFPAKQGQAISESKIKCSKGEIIVEVSWRYESKPFIC